MKNSAEYYMHSDEDRKILEKINAFLPERIFDAHAHLYRTELLQRTASIKEEYGTADANRFFADAKPLYGGRPVQALFLPWPAVELRDPVVRNQINAWMVQQLEAAQGCAAEAFVLPTDTAEDVRSLLIHPRIRGFKCYFNSRPENNGESDIADFLPESAWQVANEKGLFITLHMMKTLSPADPVNVAYILDKTKQYPNAKLILAHCGRGFAAWTILETARKLKGIPNLYYDMAAICEPAQMFEVIRQAGVDHVMWGTDYPLCQLRSRPFSGGFGTFWMGKNQHPSMPCALMGAESLFAFYQASLMLDLSRESVEDIFYNNAVRLFGLDA